MGMRMNDLIQVILLGFIEGVTEFLPISSTGHLLIAEHWLGARSQTFNVVIQAGAILAVTLIYRRRLWDLLVHWRKPANRDYLLKLTLAFGITSVLGWAALKMGFKLPSTVTPVAWTLIIGGLWMLAAEWLAARRRHSVQVTWTVATLVGLAQVVAALLPGTSRSAATIFVAMLAGTNDRAKATEFAFLLGIPTMYAASGYELLKAFHSGAAAHIRWDAVDVGFAMSAIVAFIAVTWLLDYIRVHRFTVFAVYRMLLGAVLLMSLPTAH